MVRSRIHVEGERNEPKLAHSRHRASQESNPAARFFRIETEVRAFELGTPAFAVPKKRRAPEGVDRIDRISLPSSEPAPKILNLCIPPGVATFAKLVAEEFDAERDRGCTRLRRGRRHGRMT